jgi:prepilin-type N-terminal cleavage/methylation domain-containing protein
MTPRRRGFSLLEIFVVVLVLALLAGLSVPMYTRTLESSKAEDASGIVRMIATTNRMFALDHKGAFANGGLTNACGTDCAAAGNTGCALVACRYLAADDWDKKPYVFFAIDPESANACGLAGITLNRIVACGVRRQGAAPGTNHKVYSGWGYAIDETGSVQASAGAPNPP